MNNFPEAKRIILMKRSSQVLMIFGRKKDDGDDELKAENKKS